MAFAADTDNGAQDGESAKAEIEGSVAGSEATTATKDTETQANAPPKERRASHRNKAAVGRATLKYTLYTVPSVRDDSKKPRGCEGDVCPMCTHAGVHAPARRLAVPRCPG